MSGALAGAASTAPIARGNYMGLFSRTKVVPVLKLSGAIGLSTPLRQGLSLAATTGAIERAFTMSKVPGVAVVINSPGGSPVQSSLMFKRIRQLAEEHKKTVHVFCEDVAASGGYYLAVAGDEIYADPSSIIGSIGVISASFGLDKAIERIGVERRVYTSGQSKSQLDPFKPEKPEDVERLRAVQTHIHDVFIGVVKERRAGKLNGPDDTLFSGAFWSAKQALDLGLIDGIGDVRSKMRDVYGDKIKLRLVPMGRGGLLSLFRKPTGRLAGSAASDGDLAAMASRGLAYELVSAIEERAIWARYGL
ncbi:MAG: S49 family peptidase [Pseudomonadota bacterium]